MARKRSRSRSRSRKRSKSRSRAKFPICKRSRSRTSRKRSGKGYSMYCVVCRRKVACANCVIGRDKRGRKRATGKCPKCHTKCFRYLKEN